jgi:hypothetical protein
MRRIGLRWSWWIAVLVLIVTCICVSQLIPYLGYTVPFNAEYRENTEKWRLRQTASYTIVVASNSYEDPNAGWNSLKVEQGRVVAGENPDCPDCSLSDYQTLTVEALFMRIDRECRWLFPFQFCNVAYDEELGYPTRLDTYPPIRNGRHRPSITVEGVILQK